MAESRDVVVALSYGLELVKRGAALIAAERQLCLANRAARTILEKKDGLSVGPDGLEADRASDTRLLSALLKEAMASPQKGEPRESPMTIGRKLARTSLVVRILPGPELAYWPSVSQRTALMTVHDPEQSLPTEEHALCSLYGLTRSEASLASLLIQGRGLEEAAEMLFISGHTARTHLKRIFLKTDTHRQPELVVRLLSAVL